MNMYTTLSKFHEDDKKSHRGGLWKTLISDKQRLTFGRRDAKTRLTQICAITLLVTVVQNRNVDFWDF